LLLAGKKGRKEIVWCRTAFARRARKLLWEFLDNFIYFALIDDTKVLYLVSCP